MPKDCLKRKHEEDRHLVLVECARTPHESLRAPHSRRVLMLTTAIHALLDLLLYDVQVDARGGCTRVNRINEESICQSPTLHFSCLSVCLVSRLVFFILRPILTLLLVTLYITKCHPLFMSRDAPDHPTSSKTTLDLNGGESTKFSPFFQACAFPI
jgi:hypothetical protein